MKNLKRALALVLAVMMLVGVMTVGAGATMDYADEDAISEDYVEAVDVLSGIAVLEGDGTNFRPEDTITRAEMAAVVCRVLMGKASDTLRVNTETEFADVAANYWAAGYINQCSTLGIINGYNGMFRPNDPVTVGEAAKMLLCALGYGAKEEYVGAKWLTAAMADATKLGITDADFVGTDDATREVVAYMAFNTIVGAMKVEYNKSFDMYFSGSSFFSAADQFDYAYTLAYLVHNLSTKLGDSAEGYLTYTWMQGKKEISDEYIAGNVVKEGEGSTISKGDLYKLDWEDEVAYVVNGDETTEDASTFAVKKSTKKLDTGVYYYFIDDNEDDTIDRVIELRGYLAKVTGVTAAKGSEDRFVALDVYGADDLEKVYTDDTDIAKNAYVIVVPDANDENNPLSIAVAEKVEGEIEDYSGTSDFTVGEDTYKYAADFTTEIGIAAKGELKFDTTYTVYLNNGAAIAVVAKTATVSALDYIYVIKANIKGGKDADLFNGATDAAIRVKGYTMDGDLSVYDVEVNVATKSAAKKYGIDVDDAYILMDDAAVLVEDLTLDANDNIVELMGLFAYELNEDEEIILNTEVENSKSAAYVANTFAGATDSAEVEFDSDTLYVTSKTELAVVGEEGDVKAYTGYKKFPATKGEYEYDDADQIIVYVTNGKGKTTVTAILVTDVAEVKAESENLFAAYVKAGRTTSKGTTYTFYVDGEQVSYLDSKDEIGGGFEKNVPYIVTLDEDGNLNTVVAFADADAEDKVVASAKIKGVDAKEEYVILTDDTVVYLDADTVIYDISESSYAEGSIAKDLEIAYAYKTEDGVDGQIATVIFVLAK